MSLAGGERRAHQDGPLRQRWPGDARRLEQWFDAGQIVHRRARNQMIERQQGVRLTAAEIGQQLDYRIASIDLQP